jgi:hypothetical protein
MSTRLKRREVISLLGGVAAAWSAHAQELTKMGATNATTATLPQIEVARRKTRRQYAAECSTGHRPGRSHEAL